MIRDPSKFGGHEANATIRYVEVYEISPDPEESDDFPFPYQPVQVKALRFGGYVAAAVEIETDNATVWFRTRKSGKKHGLIGNGITIEFDIDAGITPPASAAFDEGTDTLTVKVKAATTTWQQAAEAVAGVLSGAFILEASNPLAEVGSGIESETGVTTGGEDGEYAVYGAAFGVGDRDTKNEVTTGDRLWVIWRPKIERWERLSGEGGVGLIRGTAGAAPPDEKHIEINNGRVLGSGATIPDGTLVWKGARTLGTTAYTTADNSWWNVEAGEYILAAHIPGYHTEGEGEEAVIYDWVWIPNERGYLLVHNTTGITAGPWSGNEPANGTGTLYYFPHGSAPDGSDGVKVSLGTASIANPFPYAFDEGWFPVKYIGDWIGAPAIFGLTGQDLTGLPGHGDDKVLVTDGDGFPVWDDRQDAGEVPPWVFDYPDDPIPGAGGAMGEGYCITIEDGTPDVIHHDAITTDAGTPATDRDLGEFQFWVHEPGATLRTDAKWVTAEDYDDDEIQQLIQDNGAWKCVPAYTVKSTEDDTTAEHLHDAIKDNATYVAGQDAIVAAATDGAAGTNQKERLFVDISAISGFGNGKLLGIDSGGNLKFDTVANWLNTLSGYTLGNDQSIGHDDNDVTEWQDDGPCT